MLSQTPLGLLQFGQILIASLSGRDTILHGFIDAVYIRLFYVLGTERPENVRRLLEKLSGLYIKVSGHLQSRGVTRILLYKITRPLDKPVGHLYVLKSPSYRIFGRSLSVRHRRGKYQSGRQDGRTQFLHLYPFIIWEAA